MTHDLNRERLIEAGWTERIDGTWVPDELKYSICAGWPVEAALGLCLDVENESETMECLNEI